jgi:RND family efflux transporter MFP subunit
MTTSDHERAGFSLSRVLLPLALLAVGGLVGWYLMQTKPQAERKPTPRLARLVETETVRRSAQPVVVEAMGAVIPSQRVELRPQVAGVVVEVAAELEPGGRFRAGEVLFVIEPRDFELTERQRAAELADAEAQLALEMGNQEVARRESEILGDLAGQGRLDLVLRKPQLEAARARVDAARAALDAARLDLERTRIRAPFDGVIAERHVVVGSRVDSNGVVATLVGTEEFWIEVTLPARDLQWLEVPERPGDAATEARVVDDAAWQPGSERRGHVVRRLVDVEAEGRLARLLVAVPDPLGLAAGAAERPALLLGSFVRIELIGRGIEGVVIDRALLRDDDRVWLMDADDTLEIRAVRVGYRGRDSVVISEGLVGGERVVSSDLSTPVEGMPLRTGAPASDG